MHPPLPRQRILLSVLATLVLLYHATTTPAAAAVATCAPKTCGNVTLAYPFWLTDAAQPAPCGPSAFQVDCLAGGRASLSRSFRGGYKLLRISYADRTVVVANDNVQTNATGCPVPTIDVSASLSLAPFSASAAANRQLFFLFNCTPPPAPGFVDVMCPGTAAVVRLDAAYNTTAARAAAGRCTYAVVPVVGSLSPGGNAGAEYPRLLREGYVLEWRASAGDCGACSASGGQCGYDSNADAFAYVCADGSSHPARCDGKKSNRKVILIVNKAAIELAMMPCFLLFQDYHDEEDCMVAGRSCSSCPQQHHAHGKGSGGAAAAGHTLASPQSWGAGNGYTISGDLLRELGYPDRAADWSKDGVSVELGQGSSRAGSGLKPVDY
ncbi:hypothetical protein ACQ4PT_011246 [Festuca glaucescens]